MSTPSLSNSPRIRGAPPKRILPAHFTDQFSHAFGDRRSARLTAKDFPCPEEPESAAVPAKDGCRLDDHQHRPPIAPNLAQPSPEQSIGRRQFRSLHRAAQDAELL